MMKKVMLIVSCLMVFAMVANGATISLQHGVAGYTGVSDSQLGGQNTGDKTANRGLTQTNMIGSMGPTLDVYGILRFDLSGVAELAGATINAATLTLIGHNNGYPEPTNGIDVWEILPANAGWNEGTGNPWNEPALSGEVTWLQKGYGTANWTGGEGCDLVGTDIGLLPIGWYEWNKDGLPAGTMPPQHTALTASVVQGWVDTPGGNAGMLLKCQDPQATQNYFFTAQDGNLYGPVLTIDYVPEPATMVLLGLGGLMIRRKR